jgi:hypothetical protein
VFAVAGGLSPRSTSSVNELRPALEAALFSLDDLGRKHPGVSEAFLQASKRLNGVLETITEDGFESPAAVIEELAIVEDNLADDLGKSLSPEELAGLKKRIEEEMEPYKAKMDGTEFKATVEATVRATVLRRFDARGVLEI